METVHVRFIRDIKNKSLYAQFGLTQKKMLNAGIYNEIWHGPKDFVSSTDFYEWYRNVNNVKNVRFYVHHAIVIKTVE